MPDPRGGSPRASRRAERSAPGRHRAAPEPSQARRVITTGAVTALVGGGLVATAMPAGAATANDFARLRQCESGGNYAINTGNGFYGAYQFDQGTWNGLGYSGLPSNAPAALQDQAAYKLYNSRGWAPWPSCSASLGLSNSGSAPAAPDVSQDSTTATPAPATPAKPPLTVEAAMAQLKTSKFHGVLSTEDAGEVRPDALVWQAEMRKKSFLLTVDGKFGAQSQGVASLYSYLSRTTDGQPGVVGANLWNITVGDAV